MRRLALALGSALLALAAVEIALRALGLPRIPSNATPVAGVEREGTVAGLPYELEPNSRSIHAFPTDPRGYFARQGGIEYVVNSFGARDREYALEKPPRTHRIVVLGDSFTFGTGVRVEDTFCDRIEAGLAGESCPVEVINLGVRGYNMQQEIVALEHRALALQPDVVLLVVFLNDAGGTAVSGAFNVGASVDSEDEPWSRWSRLVRWFRLEALQRAALAELVQSYREAFADGSPSWASFQADLRRAAGLCSERGARLALAIFPVLHSLDLQYPWRAEHERIAAFARSLGVPVLDLLSAFLGQDAVALWVHPTNQHPNERGHAIAAQALLAFLRQERLLGD